ncbi:putative mitochondrial protein [Labeo rohita]|uniref:Mitochondrial protein n=1 Tax=Labeo rohita TaxID=84645 RepID=A0ABQ8M3M1_LABRO|nr:putative mitochondrial protein [Labeo rohita]
MGHAIQALVSQVSELISQLQHLQMEPTQKPTVPNPPAVPDTSPTTHSAEPRLPSPTVYSDELRKVFDRAASGKEAARILAELHQAHRTVTDYSIEFRTLAAECKWNTEAQWDMFLHRLSPHIQIQPMQMGQSRLSPREREKRRSRGLCLYCGEAGHMVAQCPVYVKAEKCIYHTRSVPFLGYIVSAEEVRLDPNKVKAVVDWPIPNSRKALQRFLGFARFYRRFIRNFSQLASPLTALTSTKTAFRWSNAADVAFTKLKDCFVSAPILIAPDPSRQLGDTSEGAVGNQAHLGRVASLVGGFGGFFYRLDRR